MLHSVRKFSAVWLAMIALAVAMPAQAPMQMGGGPAQPFQIAEGDLHGTVHPGTGQVLMYSLHNAGAVVAKWPAAGLSEEWSAWLLARHGKRLYVMADGESDFGGAIEKETVDWVVDAIEDLVDLMRSLLGL